MAWTAVVDDSCFHPGTHSLTCGCLATSCRLGRIAFHPMGDHLGTASYDLTWRLWDIATGDCLLEQVQI